MTRTARIFIGSILTALCVVGCAVGITFLVVAHGMPAHSDEARATELTIQYENNYIDSTLENRAPIEQQIVALRTSKWKLYNAGLTMFLMGSVILIAIIRFKLWDIGMLRFATTPGTRLRLLALASGAWLTLLPAIVLELEEGYTQDDLTPTIDTGHGSFLNILPPFFLITWIAALLIGRFVILRKASLPANLWCWDGDRPYHSITWTSFYGLIGSVIFILAALSTWALPSLLIGLYVIASTRAALINRT